METKAQKKQTERDQILLTIGKLQGDFAEKNLTQGEQLESTMHLNSLFKLVDTH